MASKPFGCTTEGIQVAGNPSSLYDVDLVTGALTLRGQITPASIYNAIGYNVKDGNIYAMRGNAVMILNTDQTVEFLPKVPNLPNLAYIAGDIDLNGRYYIFSGSQPTVIYVIDADPDSANYLQLINPVTGQVQTQAPYGIPTTAAFYADWAFSPIDGQLYAAISNSDTVARINPLTGEQTILDTTGLPPATDPLPTYGAAFADAAGALYVISNNTGAVYRVVISGDTATATLFSQAQPASAIDGTRCALAAVNALQIEKKASADTVCTNAVMTYTIQVTNVSLIDLTGVMVTDVLPQGLQYLPGTLQLNGNPWNGDPNTGVKIGTLAPGASAALTFQVQADAVPPAQNPVVNTASVTFDTGAPIQSAPVETRIVSGQRQQAVSDLLESIALQQAALSHILNAEGEKVQKALKLEGIGAAEIAQINQSVAQMADSISNLEMVLTSKAKRFQCDLCLACGAQ